MSIVATKNGKRRTFSDRTWDLLGANKEGWVQSPDTQITNLAKKPATAQRPATGSKPAKEQPIHDVSQTSSEQPIQDTTGKADTSSKSSDATEDKKAEFLAAGEGLSAGVIKDYFDNAKVKYKKSAKPAELLNQLGQELNWSVSEFQRLFS